MKRRILLPALAALVAAFSCPAQAHDQWAWIDQFYNSRGVNCCDERDAARLSRAVAQSAHVGSVITAPFPDGPLPVTVNRIHPTQDPDGAPWITKWGCLFRGAGF